MFKNTAAKFMVFAFDTTNATAKTGDAANITAYVSKDYGTVTVLADTSATEMDSTNAKGYYLFDAAQGETNGDVLMISAKSATGNISVIGAPAVIYTRPQTGWLAPTTAGRTFDVSATGEGGLDWANVGSPTTTVDLSGTTIKTTQKVDVDTIKSNPVANGGTVTFPTNATLASTTNITAGVITTTTNLTNLPTIPANWLTAAGTAADFGTEVAAAVWQDAVAGDFTTASSIGKALYIANIAPGASGGHFIAGSNAATTVNFTGNLSGSVGSVTGAVGSVTGITSSDVGAIKTKTDFLPSVTAGAAGGIFIAGTNAATAITTGLTAHIIGTVDTLTTYTGNTPQTGDVYALANGANGFVAIKGDTAAILTDTAEIGVAGAGLTNINLPDQTMNITGNLSGSVDSVTNTVDANIIEVTGITVTGTGTTLDPWGP